MERLTTRPQAALIKCSFCSNEEDCYSGCCDAVDKAFSKLKEYEDAEEQGLLIRLPAKYVFFLVDVNSKYGGMVMKKSIKDLTLYEIEQINKRKYYSAREEAEAALERMG